MKGVQKYGPDSGDCGVEQIKNYKENNRGEHGKRCANWERKYLEMYKKTSCARWLGLALLYKYFGFHLTRRYEQMHNTQYIFMLSMPILMH
jgi:hypothetical protein